jgi:hypothetical protein
MGLLFFPEALIVFVKKFKYFYIINKHLRCLRVCMLNIWMLIKPMIIFILLLNGEIYAHLQGGKGSVGRCLVCGSTIDARDLLS